LRFPEFEGEWIKTEIGNILEIGNGKDYKHLGYGDIPVLGTGGYMTSVNDFLYDGESVCIGRKGTINKPFYLKGKFWTVDTLFYTHSYKNVLPKFLLYTFEQINWLKYNEASGVPSLSRSTIETIDVSIPSVLEQQKIASFLSLIDERISTQSKIVEGLESLMRSLREKLFTQKLRFKDSNRNEFPDWTLRKLGDLGTFFSGGTPLTSKKDYYNGDIPFIKSGEIHKNHTEQFISEKALKNSSAKMVEKGDLIYALYGATSGEVGISKVAGAINQAILCVRTSLNTVYLLNYLKLQKENILKTYLQGGQGNLSAEIIKSLEILTPTYSEQVLIANSLSSFDEKIEAEKKY
jgi:type I restriction enzyme S subunit